MSTITFEHEHYMGLFSDEGNVAVYSATLTLIGQAVAKRWTRDQVRWNVTVMLENARADHPEATDTMVRDHVARMVNSLYMEPTGLVPFEASLDILWRGAA
jgi:hypothetical protein